MSRIDPSLTMPEAPDSSAGVFFNPVPLSSQLYLNVKDRHSIQFQTARLPCGRHYFSASMFMDLGSSPHELGNAVPHLVRNQPLYAFGWNINPAYIPESGGTITIIAECWIPHESEPIVLWDTTCKIVLGIKRDFHVSVFPGDLLVAQASALMSYVYARPQSSWANHPNARVNRVVASDAADGCRLSDTTFEPSPPDSIAGANDKERKHGTSCEDGNPDEEDDFGEGNDLGEEDKLGEKGDLQEGQAYKIVCARLKPSVVDGRYPRANSGQLQLLPRPVLRLGGKGKLEDEDNLGGEDQPDEDNLGEEHLPDEGPPQCEDGDFVLV